MKYYVQGVREFRFEMEINASSTKDVERKINKMSLEDLMKTHEESSLLGDSMTIVRLSDGKTWKNG